MLMMTTKNYEFPMFKFRMTYKAISNRKICFRTLKIRRIMFLFQKPLRRIQIEEIGLDKEEEEKQIIHEKVASVLATQSEAKKQTTARDEAKFDAFVKRRKDVPCNGLRSDTADKIPSNHVHNVSCNRVESVKGHAQDVSSSERCAENGVLSRTNRSLPPVPTSSIQFQADWKALRNDPDLCFQYFKVSSNCRFKIRFLLD